MKKKSYSNSSRFESQTGGTWKFENEDKIYSEEKIKFSESESGSILIPNAFQNNVVYMDTTDGTKLEELYPWLAPHAQKYNLDVIHVHDDINKHQIFLINKKNKTTQETLKNTKVKKNYTEVYQSKAYKSIDELKDDVEKNGLPKMQIKYRDLENVEIVEENIKLAHDKITTSDSKKVIGIEMNPKTKKLEEEFLNKPIDTPKYKHITDKLDKNKTYIISYVLEKSLLNDPDIGPLLQVQKGVMRANKNSKVSFTEKPYHTAALYFDPNRNNWLVIQSAVDMFSANSLSNARSLGEELDQNDSTNLVLTEANLDPQKLEKSIGKQYGTLDFIKVGFKPEVRLNDGLVKEEWEFLENETGKKLGFLSFLSKPIYGLFVKPAMFLVRNIHKGYHKLGGKNLNVNFPGQYCTELVLSTEKDKQITTHIKRPAHRSMPNDIIVEAIDNNKAIIQISGDNKLSYITKDFRKE
ncbi:MAG: hypothetical protein HRT47_01250 [Candidatus Caenarcaniphilales bacterium]|nr:hypothetical protein [Candidatus Caenarcaniphilales bacterium]